jgi:hypothetical protein
MLYVVLLRSTRLQGQSVLCGDPDRRNATPTLPEELPVTVTGSVTGTSIIQPEPVMVRLWAPVGTVLVAATLMLAPFEPGRRLSASPAVIRSASERQTAPGLRCE